MLEKNYAQISSSKRIILKKIHEKNSAQKKSSKTIMH